jgi:hypothetical protein
LFNIADFGLPLSIIEDIDVAALCLCSMESICRFGSCYLHQNRIPGRSLYDIDNIAFLDTDVIAILGHGPLIIPL